MRAPSARHRESSFASPIFAAMIGFCLFCIGPAIAAPAGEPMSNPPAVIELDYVKSSNNDSGDLFGHAVDIDGDVMVISAQNEDSASTGANGNQSSNGAAEAGAVYVFRRAQGSWVQEAYLKALNAQGPDQFGTKVAVSGDVIAVSAINESSNARGINGNPFNNGSNVSGAVYVFRRVGGLWQQEAYIKSSNSDSGDRFGWSLDLDGDRLVVGAVLEDGDAAGINGSQSGNGLSSSGAVYVFEYNDGQWAQSDYIKSSNPDAGDRFGWSVGLSGDLIVVGAPFEGSAATGVAGDQTDNSAEQAGAVYTFRRATGGWAQTAYVKAENADAGDRFGVSVDVHGEHFVVGAPFEDGGGSGVSGDPASNFSTDAGAGYAFALDNGQWQQRGYLKARVNDLNDQLGISVAINAELVVLGNTLDDSDAIGVSGDPANNAAITSGAVHLFYAQGTQWKQGAFIKSFNSESNDLFGWHVALSELELIASAIFEDSDSTGVNGDLSNNASNASGAVYTYGLLETFSVGGSVVGLADSNEVRLQNGSIETITVSANGSFRFNETLIDNDIYVVSVAEQPTTPNQVCNVEQGSGTINGANVVDVQVSCLTVRYRYGGSVAGLLPGNELTLINADAQSLVIDDNGDFQFPDSINDGSSYAVSIALQPGNPAQACTVSNGAGMINGIVVADIQVDCIELEFDLGGTLVGLLTGTEVSLSNSDGQSLILSNNGDFKFAQPVLAGSSYAVTVAVQPTMPNQVCTVEQGTGMINASDVNDVQVSCVIVQYRLGGVASGLLPSNQMTLANVDGQSLVVNTNGAFEFPAALNDGSDYAVSISQQPTNPAQLCAVSSGIGAINGMPVTDIQVDCVELEFNLGGTLSGLEGGNQIELVNSDGQSLTLTENQSYVFAAPIAAGSSYSVSVSAALANQVCRVANPSGTVIDADVNDVDVQCFADSVFADGFED